MFLRFDRKENVMLYNTRYLVLWTTTACTLNCIYCYAQAGARGEHMNFETAKKAIDLCDGYLKVQLAGGEPLLNFELIQQIYQYLKTRAPKAQLQLQTNGTLIDEAMAKALAQMGIAIGVSLDGPAAINEKHRGGTGRTIKGIQALGAAGVTVNLNCVITDESIETLGALVDWAFYLGNVGGIGLDLLRQAGRGASGNVKPASPERLAFYVQSAYYRSRELHRLFGKSIVIREVEEAKRRLQQGKHSGHYCYAAAGTALTVLPDGRLYPCGSLAGAPQYAMGNLHQPETYTVKALNFKTPEPCQLCDYQDVCPGACPARSIVNGGEHGFSIQDCTLRKVAFKIAEKEMAQCSN